MDFLSPTGWFPEPVAWRIMFTSSRKLIVNGASLQVKKIFNHIKQINNIYSILIMGLNTQGSFSLFCLNVCWLYN